MTTIHMETDKVYGVARKLDADTSAMLSNLSQARSSASHLRFGWQGGDAEEFNNDLNQLIKKIENHVMTLQNLSVRISREADEWVSTDSLGARNSKSKWLERHKLWPALGIFGPTGNAYAVLKKLLEDSKYLKNIKGLGPGLDLIGCYFSFMDDEDPNRARAAVSSTVATYGPYGVLLIPGIGPAAFAIYEGTMRVNAGIQLGVQMQVVKELWSEAYLSDPEMLPLYQEMTVTTNEFYENAERIDLENIPKDISRAVYDYAVQPYVTAITAAYDDPSVTNILRLGAIAGSTFIGGPALGTSVAYSLDPKAQQAVMGDMRAVGVDAANVVVGVVQFPFTYLEHETSYGIAQVAVTASYLPLPASWETGITQTSADLVNKINSIPEIYDLIGLEKPREY
jgi:uncharacterized protein YukE